MKNFFSFSLLLSFLVSCGDSTSKDNSDKTSSFVIELISNERDSLNLSLLEKTCKEFGLSSSSFYTWKNHLVVFGKIADINGLAEKLTSAFPGQQVKLYNDNFYTFNRATCADTTTAKEWSHTILTANLVEDTLMQKEYLEYHATQFKEWPEVSYGFCNASFQQLLMFKNGRQLMLIISIPKGKSLAELDPKTIENNPRVAEWNSIMRPFQEGIDGTDEGTTWVILEPIVK